jgi:hypothetical protein
MNTYQKILKFDDVTKFRLVNAFIFAIGFNLFVPVLLDLKGEYLAAYAISLFMIAEQLIVKTNRYFVNNFSLDRLYKIGIFIHFFFVSTALMYFWDPFWMVLMEGTLSVIVIAFFGAYSIKLNNYLTEEYPKDMSEFQIVRNSTWADGLLIGLGLTTVITFFFPVSYALGLFVIYNSGFTVWMIWNWNFYKERNL